MSTRLAVFFVVTSVFPFGSTVTLEVPNRLVRTRSKSVAPGRQLSGSRPHFRPLVSYGSVPTRLGLEEDVMFFSKTAMGRSARTPAAAVPMVDVKLNVVSIRVRAKNRNRIWNCWQNWSRPKLNTLRMRPAFLLCVFAWDNTQRYVQFP